MTSGGTGSALGSIFKGERKHVLEVLSAEGTSAELGTQGSPVGDERTASSPGNTFVRSYLQLSFDGHLD